MAVLTGDDKPIALTGARKFRGSLTKTRISWVIAGLVTIFGVAAVCQVNDRPGGRFFRPEWPVQLHAVWHVLAAVAFAGAMRLLDGNPPPPRATVPA